MNGETRFIDPNAGTVISASCYLEGRRGSGYPARLTNEAKTKVTEELLTMEQWMDR
jgi:hypothetical protein